MDWYPWVVLAHVLGAFGFVLAHGVSAFVAFRLRSAGSPEQVSTLLGLSGSSMVLAYASLLVILVAGVSAGFMGDWWGHAWIWLSIGLLLAIATAMYLVGTTYYLRVRHAVGIAGPQDPKATTFETLDPDALARLLDTRRPELLAAIGGGGLIALIALMVLKPG
jgi:Zn-dependent protease with chaperone function